jgi:hypothetical protein
LIMDEKSYLQGQRQVWGQLLSDALRHMGYVEGDLEKIYYVRWIKEREEIIQQLRSLCDEFGDNSWEEDMHLGDVIDKYLGDYLRD